MNKILLISSLISVLFFSGCSKNDTYAKAIPKEPKWLLDPTIEGKITGVGCASKHYNGTQAQKKLALQRAIDQVASQVNTTVQTTSLNKRKVEGRNYSSSTQTNSLHTVDTSIKTKVIQWYKKTDGDICVFVSKE